VKIVKKASDQNILSAQAYLELAICGKECFQYSFEEGKRLIIDS
jgi:hypothetical protein